MSQIAFEWQQPASYAPEDYIVSDSNAETVRFLEGLLEENKKSALLHGINSSGKTHFAHYWLHHTGGTLLNNSLLGKLPSEQLWPINTHIVLENIDTIKDEAALFHLLRHSEINGGFLLLTANAPAKLLPFKLPDLTSRLLALPSAALKPPDDTLLGIYIAKCFSDRQLRVSEDVVSYLVKHVERSFRTIHDTINTLERASMENKKNITVPLVKAVLSG